MKLIIYNRIYLSFLLELREAQTFIFYFSHLWTDVKEGRMHIEAV